MEETPNLRSDDLVRLRIIAHVEMMSMEDALSRCIRQEYSDLERRMTPNELREVEDMFWEEEQ